MPRRASLQLNDVDYEVVDFTISFNRDVDDDGRPSSKVYGGNIDVSVEASEDTSIVELMINNQFQPLDGILVIRKPEAESTMKQVFFKRGYIIKYSERLADAAPLLIIMKFTITAEVIKIGDAELHNSWPR